MPELTLYQKTPVQLARVKGSGERLNVELMPAKLSSLNEGDSFLIDYEFELQQWNGKLASFEEVELARKLAEKVLSERRQLGNYCRFVEVNSEMEAPKGARTSVFSRLSLRSESVQDQQRMSMAASEAEHSTSGTVAAVSTLSSVNESLSSEVREDFDEEDVVEEVSALESTKAILPEMHRQPSSNLTSVSDEDLIIQSLSSERRILCGLLNIKQNIKSAVRGGDDSRQGLQKKRLYRVTFNGDVSFHLLNKKTSKQSLDQKFDRHLLEGDEILLLDSGIAISMWIPESHEFYCNEFAQEQVKEAFRKMHVLPKRPGFFPIDLNNSEMLQHFE